MDFLAKKKETIVVNKQDDTNEESMQTSFENNSSEPLTIDIGLDLLINPRKKLTNRMRKRTGREVHKTILLDISSDQAMDEELLRDISNFLEQKKVRVSDSQYVTNANDYQIHKEIIKIWKNSLNGNSWDIINDNDTDLLIHNLIDSLKLAIGLKLKKK